MHHTHAVTINSSVPMCPRCQRQRSSIAYARLFQAQVCTSPYQHLGEALMIQVCQQEQVKRFRRIMDYDRVLDWVRTSAHLVLGIAQRPESHPLRRYLNETFPSPHGRTSWTIYPSACDALKSFPHLPHTRHSTLFTNVATQDTTLSFTLYCSLPSWTTEMMQQLETLPFGSKISREMLSTILRRVAA